MADSVLPGDLSAGDMITLPGSAGDVVVKSVRLGQGGFLLTVSAAGDRSASEQVVTLTWATRMFRTGRGLAF